MSLCQTVPETAPGVYARPATNHFGGSGGGMTVKVCVVDQFSEPFVTVRVVVNVTFDDPLTLNACVGVFPVAVKPSPKLHA